MSKKVIYIVLGALFIFGVLFLIWTWLFSGNGSTALHFGQFGTGSTTAGTGGNTTPGGNYTTSLGNNGNGTAGNGQNAANGQIPLNGSNGANGTGGNGVGGNGTTGGTGANTGGTTGGAGTGATLGTGGVSIANAGIGTINPSGVVWTGGGNSFNPSDINSVSNAGGGFAPTITSTPNNGSGGTSLIEALAGAAIAGSLTCAIQAGVLTGSTAGASTVAGTGATPPTLLVNGNGLLFVADINSRAANTAQQAHNAAKDSQTFQQCIINTIAKVALKQITVSVVNWINSGFNGQPSFVNNFQQFFTNVADLAAGDYIKNSPQLAFLCTPFKAQIKIAIAQNYANRNNGQACSLTGIINNVNSFMNGNFNQAGWTGFLSFTTVPANNPYGAYAYAQVGLTNAQNNAVANAKNNITPGGFLGLQQMTCTNNGVTTTTYNNPIVGQNGQAAVASNVVPSGCKVTTKTPGTVIEDSLKKVVDSPIDQLGIANDADQIISALTTQLTTKIMQNGLSSLSQGTTQTAADLAAQQQAASLLLDMQNRISTAQQIGSVDQASISDIQNAQSNLNSLANCWSAVASSSSSSAVNASQQAANANSTLTSLNAQIEQYNNNITALNAQIATLNDFESQISAASTQADVAGAAAGYNTAVASGSFVSQTDVTTAQQNRTTLQSQMAALNISTQSGMQQCQATH